jgi:hypothetical protein
MENSANTESWVTENLANMKNRVTQNPTNTKSWVTNDLANMKNRLFKTQGGGGVGNWKKEKALLQAEG